MNKKIGITKKHYDILKKYIVKMHMEIGELYGYPKCCIKQFAEEDYLGIPSYLYRTRKFKVDIHEMKLDYVPCDKCVKKYLKK